MHFSPTIGTTKSRDRTSWTSQSSRYPWVGGSRMKFSGREKRAEGRVRLFRSRGSAELRKVVSGSAMQGLWLRNGKVGSQVSGIDQCRLPGRSTVRKIRREGGRGRRAAIEQRRGYTVFGLDLGKREEQVVCHASPLALAMTYEARGKAEM